jgi:hypothetical protein
VTLSSEDGWVEEGRVESSSNAPLPCRFLDPRARHHCPAIRAESVADPRLVRNREFLAFVPRVSRFKLSHVGSRRVLAESVVTAHCIARSNLNHLRGTIFLTRPAGDLGPTLVVDKDVEGVVHQHGMEQNRLLSHQS